MSIMRIAIVILCLAAGSSRASEPNVAVGLGGIKEIDLALTQAEAGLRALKKLASAAVAAMNAPDRPEPAPPLTDLAKQSVLECRTGFRVDSLLGGKESNLAAGSIPPIEYFACKAAAAKSMSPCEKLSTVKAPIGSNAMTGARLEKNCRRTAANIIVLRAIIDSSGPGICAAAADFFQVAKDRQMATCQALLSGAPAAEACKKAAAVAGRTISSEARAECLRNFTLRGQTSEKICSSAAFSNDIGVCQAAFRLRDDPTCALAFEAVAARHCTALARSGTPVRGSRDKAKQALSEKYAEVEALLHQVGAGLENFEPKSDPKRSAALARMLRIEGDVQAAMKLVPAERRGE